MYTSRKSDNYVWTVNDLLGNGATGSVYKCRDQRFGKLYAAKVLNSRGLKRPDDVIYREINVLQKLSHPNIVRFIGLEKATGENSIVVVMELCEASLHDILQYSENIFGLGEYDFKDVISDVSNGMEYLRNKNVIHRDVKPGNILRVENIEDGRYIYKISDFGAARNLDKNGEFDSVYGTEEYLHPDIYAKAVMNHRGGPFNSTVDLWSLGVTFYHLATGYLPFRPFAGRNDKNSMHCMITQKEPGSISCHQNGQNGKLNFSKELPATTRISKGLKNFITPIIRGLLEIDPGRMISYEDFFRKIKEVVSMKVINVFSSKKGCLHKVYMNQDQNFSHLQDALASCTGIKAVDQELYHNFNEFKPNFDAKIAMYPEISEDNPLILISEAGTLSVNMESKVFPSLNYRGGSDKKKSGDEDATFSKIFANNAHSLKCEASKLKSECQAIYKSHDVFKVIIKSFCCHLSCNCESIKLRMNENWKHLNSNSFALSKFGTDKNGQNEKGKDKFVKLHEHLNECKEKVNSLLAEDINEKVWAEGIEQFINLPCPTKLSGFINAINEINERFTKDRSRPNTIIDDLAHNSDRIRLTEIYGLLRNKVIEFQEQRNVLHDVLNKWLSGVLNRRKELINIQERLSTIFEEFQQIYTEETQQFAKNLTDLTNALFYPIDQEELIHLAEDMTKSISILNEFEEICNPAEAPLSST